ncbi:MAG: queuosine precursor transporter [Phycisphaerales bacterium]|nr:queuosine precursor transporter [Phycisphaerales bacterium]
MGYAHVMHHSPLPTEQHKWKGLPELSVAELHRRREWVFLILAGLFLGTLAMLNILGITRFIVLGSLGPEVADGPWSLRLGVPNDFSKVNFALAVGVLPYPLTFLCTDFISELYGRKRANQVVWVGFILNLWVMFILWAGGALPGFEPAGEPKTGVFFDVQRLAFGAVAASMFAYLVAQLVDVHVFHFWKKLTKGKHLWLRNNGSTLVSQLVDTVAVILITYFYANALPVDESNPIWPQLLLFIATGYVFKMVCALADTAPFYWGVGYLTRYLRLPPATGAPHPPAAAAVEAGVG